MDREIDPQLIRRRTLRRVVVTVVALGLTWFAVATAFGLLRPGVPAKEIPLRDVPSNMTNSAAR